MRFDRDSAFPLQIHGIKELILFFAFVDRTGTLKQSIRQGGLTVIDVRDNAEIARVLDTHEARELCGRSESSTSVALVFDVCSVCRERRKRLPSLCAQTSFQPAVFVV
jgi:hypothetical protein